MKEMRVRVKFVEPLLGSSPNDEEIYTNFVGSKTPDAPTLAEEVAALGDDVVAEKGTTVFPRNPEGNPIIWNYQVEGFFKGTCGFLRAVEGTLSSKIKAYKKTVDGRIFVEGDINEDNPTGRMITIHDAFPMDLFQRPLRASTPQGERVSLACSERIPAGAWCEFTVTCYVDSDIDLVKEWLDFGIRNGMGQFRNSGHGRFTWEEIA